jgi:hypothetical protein
MEYLSPDRVRGRSGRCTAELERVLAAKALAGKPKARQGRFFRDAVARLLSGNDPSEFDALSRVQAAQLKFEVEDKLRRFYLRPGRSLEFVFTLVHESELPTYGMEDTDAYPRTAASQRGWVISNPLNPSTKRLLALKVKRAANGEAVVSTTEYWYLRWWGTREGSYVYPYRETNHQFYILHREPGNWRVYQNLRPPPRSSVPSRWHQKRRGLRAVRSTRSGGLKSRYVERHSVPSIAILGSHGNKEDFTCSFETFCWRPLFVLRLPFSPKPRLRWTGPST